MRTYNQKLSGEINAQLSRRERTVFLQRRFLVISAVLVISILILLGTSIHAFASSQNEPKTIYKYYSCIEVEKGDTLWTIADEYMDEYSGSKKEYVKEISKLNNLRDDTIYAGDHIIVTRYSAEKR